MSAVTAWEGLEARYQTVTALKAVLLGEPTAIHQPPALYTALSRIDRTTAGQVTSMRYTFTSRLVVDWQSPADAELELLGLVNAIPAAIDADPTLGGRVNLARITEGPAGFIAIGGTNYRIIDYTIDVLEKGAYQSGI